MTTMYKIKPILKTSNRDMQLPTCMYKMPYLYEEFDAKQVNGENGKRQSVQQQPPIGEQLQSILKRQQELISNLDKLEKQIGGGARPVSDGSKFTVTNLSSDERALRHVIQRQERLISSLNVLEHDVQQLVGSQNIAAAATDAQQPVKQAAPGADRPRDVCVHANVDSPPEKLRKLIVHLRDSMNKKVLCQTMHHSSLAGRRTAAATWTDFTSAHALTRSDYDLTFTIILSNSPDTVLVVDPLNAASNVHGEANVVNHLVRALNVTQFHC